MLITDRIAVSLGDNVQHLAGSFPNSVLAQIESALPSKCENTVETGCGKSTILFSNLSNHHTVFALDDRKYGDDSSVAFYENSPITFKDVLEVIFGETQLTLPVYKNFRPYDVVLIDGPHGFPFPELEYYYLVPHLKAGGFLILDDVHIASVGLMADVLKEDDMFEVHALIETTLILRRTQAPLVNPIGDGWYQQSYNRRRFETNNEKYMSAKLDDGFKMRPMQEIIAKKIPVEGFLESVDLKNFYLVANEKCEGQIQQNRNRLTANSGIGSPKEWLLKIYYFKFRIGNRDHGPAFSLSNIVKNLRRIFK